MLQNAIKNIVRGWRKSLLFWALIVLIALFFISSAVLAVSMKQYSDKTYASYRTIGLFEYISGAYPDETVYSEDVQEAAASLNALCLDVDPRVETWDVPVKAVGYHPSITRNDQDIPFYENAVLLVKTGAKKGDPWYWYVTVEQELYSVRDVEGKRIKLESMTLPLELNRYYLVNGYYQVEGTPLPILYPYTLENAQFTLKNSGDIPALKAFFLDSGYSEVRQIRKYRTFVVLNDSSFLYTTAQLEKRIATIPSFYPLAVGVGVAVACIMVFLRRKETATMQLLGTKRLRAWLNLWLEQLFLCVAGVGIGLFGFWLFKRTLQADGLRWVLILVAGYLLSAGLSAALILISKPSSRSKEVTYGNLNA